MAITLHQDFKDFLKLLNSHEVKYLLIGGYAVGFHGYPRATADLDIWVEMDAQNAQKTVSAIKQFGFDVPELTTDIFLESNKVIRLGNPPIRIEVMTGISGVDFKECYDNKINVMLDGLCVNIINYDDLIKNKMASGRLKDKVDVEQLT